MKNKKKMSSGITLIALVVTIIVLLILAGISITMLSGNNGILQRATQSKEETRGGAVQEQRDLWIVEQTSDQYVKTQSAKSLSILLNELGPNGQKLLTVDEIDTINETGQITIGSRTIVFKEILTIGSEYDKGNIKIGDKINYSANGTDNWIVFGKDNDGNVLLTTEIPVGSFSAEWKKENWFTWETDLDKACEDYSGTIQGKEIKARSIRIEDINRVTGFTEPTWKKYKLTTDEDGNGQYANGKINHYYPDEKSKTFVKATIDTTTDESESTDIPAREFFSNTYNYQQSEEEYKFSYNKDGIWTTETIDLTKNLKNVKNMKYVIGESGSYMQYYVASRSVSVGSDCTLFNGGWVGNGYVSTYGASFCYTNYNGVGVAYGPLDWGLRPIVELPSEIQVGVTNGTFDIK